MILPDVFYYFYRGIYQSLSISLFLQYDVDNLLRYDDYLQHVESFQVLLALLVCQYLFLDFLVRSIHRESHLEASLTIEGNGELHIVLLQILLIILRPCCIANAALLAKCCPQLFCDVWSEWSDEDDEICQEFLVVALLLTEFVHGNHEG